MTEDLQLLAKKYQAFYDVSPYYVTVEERHGSSSAAIQRVQTGFEVNIYGVNAKEQLAPPGDDPDYVQGCSEVRNIAAEVLDQTGGPCAGEAMLFPSTAVLESRGRPEQRALEEVEKRLEALGIRRR